MAESHNFFHSVLILLIYHEPIFLQDAIDEKLDQKHFPFLGGRVTAGGYRPTPTSVRYGHWHKDKNALNVKNVPRLIVFIVGGCTYSEMRCAYEVTKEAKNWEVVIGNSFIQIVISISPSCDFDNFDNLYFPYFRC